MSQPYDFDMAPATLEVFRGWLQNSRYPSLKSLNSQKWKTNYTDWDKVMPPGTDDVKRPR